MATDNRMQCTFYKVSVRHELGMVETITAAYFLEYTISLPRKPSMLARDGFCTACTLGYPR